MHPVKALANARTRAKSGPMTRKAERETEMTETQRERRDAIRTRRRSEQGRINRSQACVHDTFDNVIHPGDMLIVGNTNTLVYHVGRAVVGPRGSRLVRYELQPNGSLEITDSVNVMRPSKLPSAIVERWYREPVSSKILGDLI